MLLDEKTYLFNPFNLKQITDEAIIKQIDELAKRYIPEPATPYDTGHNIELAANLLYLYGEMIARMTERHSIQKLDNDKNESLYTYELRSEWSRTKTEKAPAMSYFEALALEKYQISRNQEKKHLADLTRLKYAYDSLEAKMNAWKKQLEAMKYEIGINNG